MFSEWPIGSLVLGSFFFFFWDFTLWAIQTDQGRVEPPVNDIHPGRKKIRQLIQLNFRFRWGNNSKTRLPQTPHWSALDLAGFGPGFFIRSKGLGGASPGERKAQGLGHFTCFWGEVGVLSYGFLVDPGTWKSSFGVVLGNFIITEKQNFDNKDLYKYSQEMFAGSPSNN